MEIKRLKCNISPVTLSERRLHEFSVKLMSFFTSGDTRLPSEQPPGGGPGLLSGRSCRCTGPGTDLKESFRVQIKDCHNPPPPTHSSPAQELSAVELFAVRGVVCTCHIIEVGIMGKEADLVFLYRALLGGRSRHSRRNTNTSRLTVLPSHVTTSNSLTCISARSVTFVLQ